MKKLISICLLLAASSAYAEKVATVLFTAKKVVAQNSTGPRDLKRGSALETGDAIVTSAGASARIRYLNGTLVTLGADSTYKILAYAPPQSDVLISAELTRGKMQSNTAAGKKREALKTPVVSLSIAGTTYKTFVSPSNSTQTFAEVSSGSVQANGQTLTNGQAYSLDASGVTAIASFPAAGEITITPAMEIATETPISAAESSEGSSTDASGGSSSDTSSDASSSDSPDASAEAASEVGFIATTTEVSAATSSDTGSVSGIDALPATIELVGVFPGNPDP